MGVGCRGIENGMDDSPETVRVSGLNVSSGRVPGPANDGGLGIVGEGTISDKRDGGSLRDSVFQIPVLQGNELPPD